MGKKKLLTPEQKARKAARSAQIHGGSGNVVQSRGLSEVDKQRGQLKAVLEQVSKHELFEPVQKLTGIPKSIAFNFCSAPDTVDSKSREKILAAKDKIAAYIPQ